MRKSKHTPETDMEDKTNLFKVCFEKGRRMKEKTKPEWDEVVETEINKYDEIGKIFHEFDMHMSIPVRIKCRKGAILIERLLK